MIRQKRQVTVSQLSEGLDGPETDSLEKPLSGLLGGDALWMLRELQDGEQLGQ